MRCPCVPRSERAAVSSGYGVRRLACRRPASTAQAALAVSEPASAPVPMPHRQQRVRVRIPTHPPGQAPRARVNRLGRRLGTSPHRYRPSIETSGVVSTPTTRRPKPIFGRQQQQPPSPPRPPPIALPLGLSCWQQTQASQSAFAFTDAWCEDPWSGTQQHVIGLRRRMMRAAIVGCESNHRREDGRECA